MRLRQILRVLCWGLVACWLLAGCEAAVFPKPVLGLGSDCELPCWQGIRPGETDGETAVERLAQISFVNGSVFERRQLETTPISDEQYIFQMDGHAPGQLYVRNGVVSLILLSIPEGEPVATLWRQIGEPEYVYVNDLTFRFPAYGALMFYPEQGLWLNAAGVGGQMESYEVLDGEAVVAGDMNVTEVRLVAAGSDLGDWLAEVGFSGDEVDNFVSQAEPWQGVGFYSMVE